MEHKPSHYIVSFLLLVTSCYYLNGAGKPTSYPLTATVVKVYDGDTFYVDLNGLHPVFGDKMPVRVKGIDCPEIKSKDAVQKQLALDGKKKAIELLLNHKVQLTEITRDKYFRLNANVTIVDSGLNWSKFMLESGLAVPYDGGKKQP